MGLVVVPILPLGDGGLPHGGRQVELLVAQPQFVLSPDTPLPGSLVAPPEPWEE